MWGRTVLLYAALLIKVVQTFTFKILVMMVTKLQKAAHKPFYSTCIILQDIRSVR